MFERLSRWIDDAVITHKLSGSGKIYHEKELQAYHNETNKLAIMLVAVVFGDEVFKNRLARHKSDSLFGIKVLESMAVHFQNGLKPTSPESAWFKSINDHVTSGADMRTDELLDGILSHYWG